MDSTEFWSQVMKVKSQHEQGLMTDLEVAQELFELSMKFSAGAENSWWGAEMGVEIDSSGTLI